MKKLPVEDEPPPYPNFLGHMALIAQGNTPEEAAHIQAMEMAAAMDWDIMQHAIWRIFRNGEGKCLCRSHESMLKSDAALKSD